jgi:hypothetical protein
MNCQHLDTLCINHLVKGVNIHLRKSLSE